MSVSAPFPYFIDEDVKRRNPTAVFKLLFGQRYFIFKGLRIAHTVETLSKQIHREKANPSEDSLLIKAIEYIRRARITTMTVEVICEQENPVELLMCEYEALQAAKSDKNCLNSRFINNEYFPQWISQTAINEFNLRLQGRKPTNHEKNLKRFLSNHLENAEIVEKVFKYVTEHFRASSPRRKKHENRKNLSKK